MDLSGRDIFTWLLASSAIWAVGAFVSGQPSQAALVAAGFFAVALVSTAIRNGRANKKHD